MNLHDPKQFQKYIEKAAEEVQTLSKPVKAKEKSTTAPEPTSQEPEQRIVIDTEDLVTTALDNGTTQSVPVDEIRVDDMSVDKSVPIETAKSEPTGIPMKVEEGQVVEEKIVIPNQRPTGVFVSNSGGRLREEDFVLSVDEPPDSADDIGAVVAEIKLEDDDHDYEGGDEGGDEDDGYYDEDDEDEDEDKYGRTTSRVITADIEREMQALQARIRERQEEEAKRGVPQPQIELQNAAQIKISQHKEAALPAPKKGVTSDKLDISIIPQISKSDTEPLALPPPPTLDDPDDALPFLVDLLVREQMIEVMKKAGLNTTIAAAQNDGW